MGTTFDIFCRMENCTFREKQAGEKSNIKSYRKAFLYSVVYYFGEFLKSAGIVFVRHKIFISL